MALGNAGSASYDQPEISGSSLMTYAMAWGINNGLLDRKVYKPVVTKAWAGILKHIYADGRLGDIQQTGSARLRSSRDIAGTTASADTYWPGVRSTRWREASQRRNS